jgi:hypothetical protein
VMTVTTRGVMVTSRPFRQEKRNTVVLQSSRGSMSRLGGGGRGYPGASDFGVEEGPRRDLRVAVRQRYAIEPI